MHEAIQPYSSSLLAVAVLVLMVAVQSFISTYTNLLKRNGTPGAALDGGHTDKHWRIDRVFRNSLENLSMFTAAVFAAILLGASASWLGILAWVHVVARLCHWIIYALGIGAMNGGPRTISFVVSFFCTGIIAVMAILAGL